MTEQKAPKTMPNMAIVMIGFTEYVMPIDKATQLMKCLEMAERYKYKYRSRHDEDGPEHYVWQEAVQVQISMLSYDDYLAGKLTGEYEHDSL